MLTSMTLSISIVRKPEEVYAFVSNVRNLPKWAPAFCKSVQPAGSEWIVETPDGPVTLSMTQKNPMGILDHHVVFSSGGNVFVPMRVVPNESGSEVLFTLFRQPSMPDEKFTGDIQLVRRDLASLKRVLEAEPS